MVTKALNATGPLPREERDVWFRAYIAALESAAIDGKVISRSLSGLVRASAEAAWASLDAYRKAARGDRS